MGVADADTVDLVAHDPNRDEAVLVLIEDRPWGNSGTLLPDLEIKLNTYLLYVTQGNLAEQFPDLKGKPVHVQLRSSYSLGEPELNYLRIVCMRHFAPAGIRFSWRVLGEQDEHGV